MTKKQKIITGSVGGATVLIISLGVGLWYGIKQSSAAILPNNDHNHQFKINSWKNFDLAKGSSGYINIEDIPDNPFVNNKSITMTGNIKVKMPSSYIEVNFTEHGKMGLDKNDGTLSWTDNPKNESYAIMFDLRELFSPPSYKNVLSRGLRVVITDSSGNDSMKDPTNDPNSSISLTFKY